MNDIQILKELEKETGKKIRQIDFDSVNNKAEPGYAVGENEYIIGLNLDELKLVSFPLSILKLERLTALSLLGNRFSKFPKKILELKNLQSLNLSSNQLSQLPPDICELKNLQSLNLRNNQLSQLPPDICELKNLQSLDMMNNQLSQLPPDICELKNLQSLDVSYNQLSQLPPDIAEWGMEIKWEYGYDEKRRNIFLEDNPLESPPVEIVKQGTEAVRNYFESVTEDTVRLYEAKLLIVGRGEVGKTCLMKKLMDPEYQVNLNEQSTDGVDIQKWHITQLFEDQTIDFCVNFWDFGGQEIYHATHQFFLTKRSFYMIVWDARKEEDYLAFDYWLNVIKLLSGSSPTILVMNKADERIKELEQESITKKFPNVKRFYQVSTLTGKGINDLRRDIREFMVQMPHIGDRLPKVWTDIRQDLENLNENYISYDRFKKIAGKYSLNEKKADFLSDYFHDLGVFLHFRNEELLEHIVILKPEWGTNAVYNVLDDSAVRENRGKFTRENLRTVWKNYPSDKHPHLLQLMKKFELCFEISRTRDYVAPELMAADTPGFDWNSADNLHFEYHYEFMPAGIITRFIVRQHMNIYKDTYWKNGVLLEFDNTRIRVIAEPLNRKIIIRAEGRNKTGALAIVRSEIGHIHDTLNHPEVREMIPCICHECRNTETPHLYEYSILQKFRDKGKTTVTCNKSVENMPIEELIMGITNPPQEWDVFITFASGDFPTVSKIIKDLKNHNIRYWLDDEQIMPGDSVSQAIEDGLLNSRAIMPCFSRNQLKSGWVRAEYSAVLYRKFSGKTEQKIVPLILDDMDDTEMPLLFGDIRHERYSDPQGYKKLLHSLKQGTRKKL